MIMTVKAYYRFNGNSNDASGNGYNGSDANITYSQNNGVLTQGAGFNGSSSKITMPSGFYSIFNGTNSYTVSALIYVTSLASQKCVLHCSVAGNVAAKYTSCNIFIYTNGNVILARGDGSLELWTGKSAGIQTNKWYLITVIRDAGNNKNYFYVDGRYLGSSNDTLTAVTAGKGQIGVWIESGSNYYWFTSGMDEMKIDNTVLPHSSVKNEYSRIKGFF